VVGVFCFLWIGWVWADLQVFLYWVLFGLVCLRGLFVATYLVGWYLGCLFYLLCGVLWWVVVGNRVVVGFACGFGWYSGLCGLGFLVV